MFLLATIERIGVAPIIAAPRVPLAGGDGGGKGGAKRSTVNVDFFVTASTTVRWIEKKESKWTLFRRGRLRFRRALLPSFVLFLYCASFISPPPPVYRVRLGVGDGESAPK